MEKMSRAGPKGLKIKVIKPRVPPGMSVLEKATKHVRDDAQALASGLKEAVEAADDLGKLSMAYLCARKAQIELDSCLRYLKEAGK